MRNRTKLGTRDKTGGYRAVMIACGIGVLVAAAEIWFSNRSFANWSPTAPLIDFCIVTYGTLLILKLQRNLVIGTIIVVPLFVGGMFGMLAKYSLMWSAISFGDLLLLPDLFEFYGWLPVLGASAVLVLFVGLFLYNFRYPRRSDIPVLLPALLAAIFLATRPIVPGRTDLSVPFYLGNWGTLAVSTYRFADEYAEARRLAETFGKATSYPDFTTAHLTAAKPRNVYIVLIESLFNPHEIEGVRFDREPLAPPFDSWFQRGGAHAMSPVFGGRSADAEFEVLCGLPAGLENNDVLFARLEAENIDCLPAKLGRLGWNSISMVPVPGTFFNKEDAYRRIGFAESIFLDRIDASDRDGEIVSAQSLLEQQMQVVKRMLAEKRPFLSYVFPASGHFPYPLNLERRPKVVTVTPSEPMIEAYANAVYYNTLAVGRFIEAVRKLDPTALIVTLGDHPPVIIPEQKTTVYPGPAGHLHQVPLMIFDGVQGEVPLTGWVPDYQLPEIILDRLTDGQFCAENRCYRKEPTWIRSTGAGVSLIDAAQGNIHPCDADAPQCIAAADEIGFWKSRIYALMGLP